MDEAVFSRGVASLESCHRGVWGGAQHLFNLKSAPRANFIDVFRFDVITVFIFMPAGRLFGVV